MRNELICGIDFGTSNSAISIIKNNKVLIIDSKTGGPKTMPSLIYFEDWNKYTVGDLAIEQYLLKKDGRLVQSVKTFLSDKSFTQTCVFGEPYTLEDFVAIILNELKSKAEKYLDATIQSVILGRPVKFSDNIDEDALANQRLINAAKKVGFKNIGIQIEPIAAALDYESSLKKEQLIMVGDFGGGTSDFTIMKLSPDRSHLSNRVRDVLGTSGINIAGDSFDSRVMWNKLAHYFGKGVQYESYGSSDKMLDIPVHILRTLCEWHRIPFLNTRKYINYIDYIKFNSTDRQAIQRLEDVITHNLGFNIFQAIGKGKSKLSLTEKSSIHVINDCFEIIEKITRDEFKKIIEMELREIEKCYLESLKQAGVDKRDIQVFFLTGGTSNLPHIKQIFFDEFGQSKVRQQSHGFASVAHGLIFKYTT